MTDVSSVELSISRCGDCSLKVIARTPDAETAWRAVHRIADTVNAGSACGLIGAIATYDSVLVEFDPLLLLPSEAETALSDVAATTLGDSSPARPASTFEIPVAYGGEFGPDLIEVARHLDLPVEEVIRSHVTLEHVVRCYSHSATAMLDGPPLGTDVPRLPDPRLVVPAGSVTLAGSQAVVLACTQASGWRIIGRTPVALISLDAPALTAYRPGDVFRYRRIHADRWTDLAGVPFASCRV